MNERGITYICSQCGQSHSTPQALRAHAKSHHGSAAPTISAGSGQSTPRTPELPAELSPRAHNRRRQILPPRHDQWGHTQPKVESQLHPRIRRGRLLVAIGATLVAALVFGLAYPHQIAHQIALAVTRQPTPFTELYFSDPKGLPKSLSISRPNHFGFTIVNHEGRDDVYSYSVTLASRYGTSVIARGRVDVEDNMKGTRLIDVTVSQRTTLYLVTVNLLKQGESIWFRGTSE